jgi:putative transposase
MGKTTKSLDAALKAKIAFEAAKGEKTISQLTSEYGVHPNQIGQLKVELEWLKKKVPDGEGVTITKLPSAS